MNINPSNSFIVRWSLCFSLRNTPPKFQGWPGGGGSGIPVYSKKIRQNTQKYPKFIQIYPKLYQGILYT